MAGKPWTTILSIFGVVRISQHREILDAIDSESLNVDVADTGGRTMLMEAVIRKDAILVDELIARGADVKWTDKRQWTALHFAAQNNDLNIGKKLIAAGADVNAQDDIGNNVISRAVFNSREDHSLVKELLENGADPNHKNSNGRSASDLVPLFQDDEFSRLFAARDCNP